MAAVRCRCGIYIKPPRTMCKRCAVAMARGFSIDDPDLSGVRPAIERENKWWYISGIVLIIGGLWLLSWWLNK